MFIPDNVVAKTVISKCDILFDLLFFASIIVEHIESRDIFVQLVKIAHVGIVVRTREDGDFDLQKRFRVEI